jgi:rod shape-determining protein MreC
MVSLFAFLLRLRAFFVFLALEGLCLYLMVQENAFQRIEYLNTSNYVAASIYQNVNQVKGYFFLVQANNDLAEENAVLKQQLGRLRQSKEVILMDSLSKDTGAQYKFIVAKVINNSVSRINNYLTLNKGTADGVNPGMGLISPLGVVGRVRNCSEHFATVTSLLHSKMTISAEIGRTRAFGSIKWKGTNTRTASLLYIARHLKPKVGDTIVTSSLSTVFPQGIPVGRISKVSIKDDDTFYTIDVILSASFGTLDYVYVVNNSLKLEQDSLEAKLPE